MLKNRIISAISSIAIVCGMMSAFAVTASAYTTSTDVAASNPTLRYEVSAPDGYTDGSDIHVKLYVDNLPTLDLYRASSKAKWNGSSLAAYSIGSKTMFDGFDIMDVSYAFDSASNNYAEETDDWMIVFAPTDIAKYLCATNMPADPYIVDYTITLSKDLTEQTTFTIDEVKLAFQSFISGASTLTPKAFYNTPITIGPSAPLADFTALNAALAKQKADTSEYTAASVATYNAALAAAKAIDQEKETDQAKVTAAAVALENAIAGLQVQLADFTALKAALAKEKADTSVYTAESLVAYTAALAVAKAIDQTAEKDQAKVTAAAVALENAIAALELKPTSQTINMGEKVSGTNNWGRAMQGISLSIIPNGFTFNKVIVPITTDDANIDLANRTVNYEAFSGLSNINATTSFGITVFDIPDGVSLTFGTAIVE